MAFSSLAQTGLLKYMHSILFDKVLLLKFNLNLFQLRSFLHQDFHVQINRHLAEKGKPAFRVVVLHDNLGAVNYALGSLNLEVDQYFASDRWKDLYELNRANFVPLKNANEMGDEEWAKLSPIHLLLSCLPEKNFDSARHQLAGREVGRRQFAEGGQLMDTNFQLTQNVLTCIVNHRIWGGFFRLLPN